jgi:hypothetical protein
VTPNEKRTRHAAERSLVALLGLCVGGVVVGGFYLATGGGVEGAVAGCAAFAASVGIVLATLCVGILRQRPDSTAGRHATVQPGKVLLTVGMTERPCMKTDIDMLGTSQQLADADLAIDLFPEERRAKVVKYRYGPTDAVEPVVVVVKVPGS